MSIAMISCNGYLRKGKLIIGTALTLSPGLSAQRAELLHELRSESPIEKNERQSNVFVRNLPYSEESNTTVASSIVPADPVMPPIM